MNLEKAVYQCAQLEKISTKYAFHIGLTGGCLYKNFNRKDCDIILYRIRQNHNPDLGGFFKELVSYGWSMEKHHGWVQKMKSPAGDDFDFFYPEYIDKTTFWSKLKHIFNSKNQSGGY